MQSRYKYNKQHGPAQVWFADGTRCVGNYYKGDRHGEWRHLRDDYVLKTTQYELGVETN